MSLDNKYQDFISSLSISFDLNDIDYLGINIDENDNIRFKIYYSQNSSTIMPDNFHSFLRSRDMIRYYEMVTDSTHHELYRIDYGLKNRNNNNISALFSYIQNNGCISSKQIETATRIAGMKTTNVDNYDLSSIYFISVETVKDSIQQAKLHYYTRYCTNPDTLSINSDYKDQDYIRFIKNLNIKQFDILTNYVDKMMAINGNHLWMIGYDAAQNGDKYKIYIKNETCDSLISTGNNDTFFGVNTKYIEDWYCLHKEYYLYGLALCIDSNFKQSINYYFLKS